MPALWPTEHLRGDLPGERPSPFLAAPRGSRADPLHTWSGAPWAPQAGLGRRGSPWSDRGIPASRPPGSGPGDERGLPCRVWVGGQPRPPCRRAPRQHRVLREEVLPARCPRPAARAPLGSQERGLPAAWRPSILSHAPGGGRSATGLKGGNPEASSAPRSEEETTPASEPRGRASPQPLIPLFPPAAPAWSSRGRGGCVQAPRAECETLPAQPGALDTRRGRPRLPPPQALLRGPCADPAVSAGTRVSRSRETPPDALSRQQSFPLAWRGLGSGKGRRREEAALTRDRGRRAAGGEPPGFPPARSQFPPGRVPLAPPLNVLLQACKAERGSKVPCLKENLKSGFLRCGTGLPARTRQV